MKKTLIGRRAIFRGKKHGVRVQAIITRGGGEAIEVARITLAALVGWDASEVSDADVVEFLARGTAATRAYLRKHPLS